MRLFWSVLFMLSACGPLQGSDQAELRNIKPSNQVPKSSPAQLVRTFDRFCMSPQVDRAELEDRLRDANYAPTRRATTGKPQVFLVDDRRPAVVISDRACSVRALSRTGQTKRVGDYVMSNFLKAKPLDPGKVGHNVEQLWMVSAPERALIATERTMTLDGYTEYALTIFRPLGQP